MKKILTLLFMLSIASSAFAFSDIPTEHKNKAALDYLSERGVIGGYKDGTFQPERTINRAELMKILITPIYGSNPTKYGGCFPDVQFEWYAPYICYAKEQGWVKGYEDGTFRPSQTVTKVEAIKMLLETQRILMTESKTLVPFSDINTDEWYGPYLRTAYVKNLLEDSDVLYHPASGMTRAKISESLYRAMVIKDKGIPTFNNKKITLPPETVLPLPGDAKDCKNDVACLQAAAKTCSPAFGTADTTLNVFGIDIAHTSRFEVRGKEGENCAVYWTVLDRTVTLQQESITTLKEEGDTDADIAAFSKHLTESKLLSSGTETICAVPMSRVNTLFDSVVQGKMTAEDIFLDATLCDDSMRGTPEVEKLNMFINVVDVGKANFDMNYSGIPFKGVVVTSFPMSDATPGHSSVWQTFRDVSTTRDNAILNSSKPHHKLLLQLMNGRTTFGASFSFPVTYQKPATHTYTLGVYACRDINTTLNVTDCGAEDLPLQAGRIVGVEPVKFVETVENVK